MKNKNKKTTKITKEDIFLDLFILLSEEYNGKIEQKNGKIWIIFDNGQSFVIETKEVA